MVSTGTASGTRRATRRDVGAGRTGVSGGRGRSSAPGTGSGRRGGPGRAVRWWGEALGGDGLCLDVQGIARWARGRQDRRGGGQGTATVCVQTWLDAGQPLGDDSAAAQPALNPCPTPTRINHRRADASTTGTRPRGSRTSSGAGAVVVRGAAGAGDAGEATSRRAASRTTWPGISGGPEADGRTLVSAVRLRLLRPLRHQVRGRLPYREQGQDQDRDRVAAGGTGVASPGRCRQPHLRRPLRTPATLIPTPSAASWSAGGTTSGRATGATSGAGPRPRIPATAPGSAWPAGGRLRSNPSVPPT
jgi:hypothetical protein